MQNITTIKPAEMARAERSRPAGDSETIATVRTANPPVVRDAIKLGDSQFRGYFKMRTKVR